jgi:predicted nuclease of predicted toxin-antitoxin system
VRLLFDQNLSARLPGLLEVEYLESVHVRWFNLASAADSDVWAFAVEGGYVIVSKDSDFEQQSLLYGHPPKVVWLRVGNCPTAAIVALPWSRLQEVLAFAADPEASFLALAWRRTVEHSLTADSDDVLLQWESVCVICWLKPFS